MPRRFSPIRKALFVAIMIGSSSAGPAFAGAAAGGATEFTQILNNGELISLVGQSTTQINNQIQQIAQLAQVLAQARLDQPRQAITLRRTEVQVLPRAL